MDPALPHDLELALSQNLREDVGYIFTYFTQDAGNGSREQIAKFVLVNISATRKALCICNFPDSMSFSAGQMAIRDVLRANRCIFRICRDQDFIYVHFKTRRCVEAVYNSNLKYMPKSKQMAIHCDTYTIQSEWEIDMMSTSEPTLVFWQLEPVVAHFSNFNLHHLHTAAEYPLSCGHSV